MKLSVFVRNKNLSPASFYRITQYVDKLDVDEIEIYEYQSDKDYKKLRSADRKKALKLIYKMIFFIKGSLLRNRQLKNELYNKKTDVVFIQREVFPKYMLPTSKYIFKKYINNCDKIIWDFDDNIIESGEISEYEKNLLEKASCCIVVTGEYLRNTINHAYHKKVSLIPTTDNEFSTINIENLNLKRLEFFTKQVNLVWVGTFANLGYLKNILPYLDKAAEQLKYSGKILSLNIVSNGSIDQDVQYININNIKWTRERASVEMEKAHIGLMPLEDNYYTLGKAGFKAVQYIGMGIPTIVSNVGFNKEVVENDYNGYLINNEQEWIDSIVELAYNQEKWIEMSNNARRKWEEKFNSNYVTSKLNKIILDS